MKKFFTLTERAMHVTHCDNIGNNVRDMNENIFTNKVFSRFTFHFSRKSAAFTLAEVLITLGIIGVVAAMTLPTLINETQRKQDGVKIKKFYSIMQQAIIMSERDNGSAADWLQPAAIRDEDGKIVDYNQAATLEIFNQYLAPYIKTVQKQQNTSPMVTFADGSTIDMTKGNCIDIIFDLNGSKQPNSFGRDQFDFLLCDSNYNERYLGKDKYFGPHSQATLTQQGRDTALQTCKTNPDTCGVLLLIDNFEFKKDYPHRR